MSVDLVKSLTMKFARFNLGTSIVLGIGIDTAVGAASGENHVRLVQRLSFVYYWSGL